MLGTSNVIFDFISLLVHHYQFFLILPIVMAFKVEKHYVARTSILANTVGMFVAVAPYWDVTRSWLSVRGVSLFHVYVLVGLIFGIWAFVSYMWGSSQNEEFYEFTWIFYNSAIAAIVCLVATVLL